MARLLPETLIWGQAAAPHLRSMPPPSSSRLINLRGRSGRPEKFVQILEVDLEGGGEAAARRLEAVIHGIVVRRAAPKWLPFIPGSSYWVPPRAWSRGLAELLGRASSTMTEEEVMSLTTVRGWPCSAHLIGDADADSDAAEKCLKEDSVQPEYEDS